MTILSRTDIYCSCPINKTQLHIVVQIYDFSTLLIIISLTEIYVDESLEHLIVNSFQPVKNCLQKN